MPPLTVTSFVLALAISVVSVLFGIFIYRAPLKAFDIQKRFYRLINWSIEPISLQKEVRNTKLMGVFLICFVIGVWIYVLFR